MGCIAWVRIHARSTWPMGLCGCSHEGPKGLTEIQSSNRFHHLLSYQKQVA
ncbi:hypothetical protein PVAP13_7KG382700 [Panicum virgatum]|uniref:Uncharacterized protein n=1 Tax=Panicum virgatum TaxID=38727 RepID=A0A8T0QR76_PANVG|nr:hypothetical protein PVAP13_7KG382700 [Panicum virgatum]